ncbi:hypothetical protein PIB30_063432 [Stylosanthes scabra]|uniref:F-box associated domain-containing protein n=1 Tax=Stylosanthes scabra TaxID=79078 RepID=A0ABU6WM43_9FABA|nr:hypothetical protein [Stylosanthes scabra]
MIHILGNDFWREIKNISDDFPRFNVKFVNDTPKWLVRRNIFMMYHPNNSVIVFLDMGREEFHEVSPPMNVIGDLNLSLLKDGLFIVNRRFMNSDVWVMKEYGKVESTKFFSIPIYKENPHSCPFYNIIHCISEDDENGVMLLWNKSGFLFMIPGPELLVLLMFKIFKAIALQESFLRA